MNNILYDKGQIGFTAPSSKGNPGAAGYNVHFSTLSLETEMATIKDSIQNHKPLSNNEELRNLYHAYQPYPETFKTDDIIIDDFGKFAVITDTTNISINIIGDIIKIDDDDNKDVSEYADLFADASTLELVNNPIPEVSSYLSRNTYNYYSFITNDGTPSGDGIDCPLYCHRDNIDRYTYGNFYKVDSSSDTYDFITSVMDVCTFSKIMITFSTGLIYEKVFNNVNDCYAYIDNRYYYGYGRGTTVPANSILTDSSSDSSWGGSADSNIWTNVSRVDRYYPNSEQDDSAETCDNLKAACRNINNDGAKHSIVNAHIEFHTKDGYVFNTPLKLKETA